MSAGRKTAGTMRGSIYIEGFPKQQDSFRRCSGYVEQFDIHSVRQHLGTDNHAAMCGAFLQAVRVQAAAAAAFVHPPMALQLCALSQYCHCYVCQPAADWQSVLYSQR